MNNSKPTTDVLAQDEFSICVKQQLDDSTQQLPSHIVSKLHQARNKAVEQSRQQRAWFNWNLITQHPVVASCASLFMVALIVGYIQFKPSAEQQMLAMDAEAEILFADDDMELYEDLEFYRWLANTGY